jgi:transcriptional regulator
MPWYTRTGTLRAVEDRAWLKNFVERLTEQHEAGRTPAWKVSDAPADFIEQMTQAIVGIELRITRLVGKWKMSQNRPVGDRDGIVAGLSAEHNSSAAAMAAWLEHYEK